MTYTIIGSDGQQYGPSTEAELRQWIAEGRLNAQSLAKGEGDAEFRPLAAFPEFADALPRQAPQPSAPPPLASPAELPAGDYNLDIGGCIAGGWKLVMANFWPSVGVSFLVTLVMVVLNQTAGLFMRPEINRMVVDHDFSVDGVFFVGTISILTAPIYTVLMAGWYIYFLKMMRGQGATVGDAFSGFGPSLVPLILLGWVQGVLTCIGIACCVIPGIYLAVAWLFALPLVIDQRMGFWEAMELSRKMVSKHWFVVFGFLIVYCLVAMAGVLACCIGIFVSIPIGIASVMCAYESIFSQRLNR